MKIEQMNLSKLFFGKWMYRIQCEQKGSNILRCVSAKTIISSLNIGDPLRNFVGSVAPFLENKNIKIRMENSHFNLYTNDLDLVIQINNRMSSWIKKISGPTTQEEIDFLNKFEGKKVLCKNLPYMKYQYKIFINFHDMNQEEKENFWRWSKNYEYKLQISKLTERYLTGKSMWASREPYIYVDNNKTLTIVSLYLGKRIKKVQEYVCPNISFVEVNT